MKHLITGIILFTSFGLFASNYAENIDGEISSDRFNPTAWDLDPGSNVMNMSVTAGDLDYFTFTIEPNEVLTALYLTDYPIPDASFFGMMEGGTFTEPPVGTIVGNLLAWTLINTPLGDKLPELANSDLFGAQGFDLPLGPGTYTVWHQQTSNVNTPSTMNFFVEVNPPIPTMSQWAMVIFGLITLTLGTIAIYNRQQHALNLRAKS